MRDDPIDRDRFLHAARRKWAKYWPDGRHRSFLEKAIEALDCYQSGRKMPIFRLKDDVSLQTHKEYADRLSKIILSGLRAGLGRGTKMYVHVNKLTCRNPRHRRMRFHLAVVKRSVHEQYRDAKLARLAQNISI